MPTNTSLDLRHSAWWLENSKLGRVWLGLTSQATDGIAEINLSNAAVSAGPDVLNWGGGLFLRAKDNRLGNKGLLVVGSTGAGAALPLPFGVSLTTVLPQVGDTSDVGDGSRRNLVKYVSPTFEGFNFQAAWGEDHFWDVALRYANEFNGLRVAAGVGWQQWNDGLAHVFPGVPFNTTGTPGTANELALLTTGTGINTGSQGDRQCANLAFAGRAGRGGDVDCGTFGSSASLLHVSTGLFIAGGYGFGEDNFRQELFARRSGGVFRNASGKDDFWNVQAGIEKNWFGLGKTDFYGEYGVYTQGAGMLAGNANNLNNVFFNFFSTPANVATSSVFLKDSEVRVWGFGWVQSIDAAAMDLYFGFRNFSTDLNVIAIERAPARTTPTVIPVNNIVGTPFQRNIATDDIQVVMTGAIIRF